MQDVLTVSQDARDASLPRCQDQIRDGSNCEGHIGACVEPVLVHKMMKQVFMFTLTSDFCCFVRHKRGGPGPKNSPGLWLGPAHNNRCAKTHQPQTRVSKYLNLYPWYFTFQIIALSLMLTKSCVKSIVLEYSLRNEQYSLNVSLLNNTMQVRWLPEAHKNKWYELW